MTGISRRLDSLESTHTHGTSGNSPSGQTGNDGQLAEALRAQIYRLMEDLRGKEERMQMMEEELEQTRGRGQGLARELGSSVGGREQAKSSLPFYVSSGERSHWLSRVHSSEREVVHGRQELTGRVAGHELVEGSAGKREEIQGASEEREGGREGGRYWLRSGGYVHSASRPHTQILPPRDGDRHLVLRFPIR